MNENDLDENVTQSGVVPYIFDQGHLKVIIITSSSGKKWIFPKGFIDPGFTPETIAVQEAFEEAGVEGDLDPDPLGIYNYFRSGEEEKVIFFPMKVFRINQQWPECSMRRRMTVTMVEAEKLINDKKLSEFIGLLAERLSIGLK